VFLLSQNLNKKTQNLNDSYFLHGMMRYKPELHVLHEVPLMLVQWRLRLEMKSGIKNKSIS